MTPAATNRRRCPSCTGPVPPRKYLCRDCWFALPEDAQRALSKCDRHATTRLQALLEQLRAKTPLHAVRVPP